MLKVTFTESGQKLSLRLVGHAEYAEHGKDIVCASASILASTVAYEVELIDRLGGLKEPAVVKVESGDTEITCVPTDEKLHIVKLLYDFASTGLCLLAGNYPQYVRFNTLT